MLDGMTKGNKDKRAGRGKESELNKDIMGRQVDMDSVKVQSTDSKMEDSQSIP